MELRLRKIWHRGAERIGLFFPYNATIRQEIRKVDARFSKTLSCWYCDYTKENYSLLKQLPNNIKLIIEKDKQDSISNKGADFKSNREILPIAGKENSALQRMTSAEAYDFAHKSTILLVDP